MDTYTSQDGFTISSSGYDTLTLSYARLPLYSNTSKVKRFPLSKLSSRLAEAKAKMIAEADILARHGLLNPLDPSNPPAQ